MEASRKERMTKVARKATTRASRKAKMEKENRRKARRREKASQKTDHKGKDEVISNVTCADASGILLVIAGKTNRSELLGVLRADNLQKVQQHSSQWLRDLLHRLQEVATPK